MPHRLQASTCVRTVKGGEVVRQLDGSHVALYQVLQGWENRAESGERVPCTATWEAILKHWPGGDPPCERWARVLLGELMQAGWVRGVPRRVNGRARTGYFTVRDHEYAPPAASRRSPPSDSRPGSAPPPADVRLDPVPAAPDPEFRPDPEVDSRPSLYSEEVETVQHPDCAPDPRGTGQAGAGAGASASADPQDPHTPAATPSPTSPTDPLPLNYSARHTRWPRRTTPLPEKLQGLALSHWLLDATVYTDEERVTAVRNIERTYGPFADAVARGKIHSPTAIVESAVLARRRGAAWFPEAKPKPDPLLPLGELAQLPADEVERLRLEAIAATNGLLQELRP